MNSKLKYESNKLIPELHLFKTLGLNRRELSLI